MNYSVTWNGTKMPIKTSPIKQPPYNEITDQEFVLFPFGGKGKLVIKSDIAVTSAIIRPLSYKMTPSIIDEHTIEIELYEPKKFSLEINGTFYNNLLIFASDTHDINESDFKNIIRFAPGEHTVGRMIVKSPNTLVILDEGAVVHGCISIENTENVTVCGHGIITKKHFPVSHEPYDKHLIHADHSKNVNIYDITLSNSVNWNCAFFGCDNCHIDNINIIGWRGNTDGVDICGSRNVLVERVFTRTWDDSFVCKAFDSGDVYNIEYRDSVLWNDFARPLEVGVELRADSVSNVKFHNIDIIHSMTGYPMMGIHHGDRAVVSDILMDDIRLEDIHGGQLFDIRITDSVWNKDAKKGGIHDITIKNIALVEEQYIMPTPSRLSGFDENAGIKNVTLENFTFFGRAASSIEECQVEVLDFVENFKYIAPTDKPTLNKITTELQLVEEPTLGTDGLYHAKAGITLTNTSANHEEGNVRLYISPVNLGIYDGAPKKFALEPNEKAYYEFDIALQAGKYVLEVQSDDPSVQHAFKYIALDHVISGNIEDATPLKLTNFYNNITDDIRFAAKDDTLIIKAPKGKDITLYTALPAKVEEGEIMFTVEETDFGIAPAVTYHNGEYVLAPQIRCPEEVTYVFLNQPKVDKVNMITVPNPEGAVSIPFAELGLPGGCKNFWLELVLPSPVDEPRRRPYALFHSVDPMGIAHMFGNVVVR